MMLLLLCSSLDSMQSISLAAQKQQIIGILGMIQVLDDVVNIG